jgi:hypothetical protein
MNMRVASLVLASTSLFVLHCGTSSPDGGFAPPGSSGASSSGGASSGFAGGPLDSGTGEEFECKGIDLIFVIDDSGSMKEEQSNLAKNLNEVIATLNAAKSKKGLPLDYRVAITTTGRNVDYTIEAPLIPPLPQSDKGDNGAFRQKSECGSTRRWLQKGDANLATAFSCLTNVGTGGSSLEMPLEATRLAIEDRMADNTNAGFLRPDALLATVILTDEDDCSRSDNNFKWKGEAFEPCHMFPGVRPIADYVAALDKAAKGSGRWATSVISGLGPGKCTSAFGEAVEARRLKDFVSAAGANGSSSSICEGDLLRALKDTLAKFDNACKRLPPPIVK